jgi:L-galactose dehydrogenase
VQYKLVGRTGLSVSQIGFGASALGNVFGSITDQDSDQAVAAAVDAGINVFDVSPYYGMTLAEERLGRAIGSHRSKIILATKCGRYGTSDFDFAADTVIRRFEDSLRRLRTDYVDILQLHDVEFGDIEQIVSETIPALQQLKKAGKTRFIGITGYPPDLLAKIAACTVIDTVLSYCHYNLLIDDMDETLTPLAKSAGLGLFNASPLHMGLLSDNAIPDWHPAPPRVRLAAERVVAECRKHGVSPTALAIQFCAAHPYVASTFIGMSHRQQVLFNTDAIKVELDSAFVEHLKQIVGEDFNTVWASPEVIAVRVDPAEEVRQDGLHRHVSLSVPTLSHAKQGSTE